ncbi:MAG: sugar ABC transporter ATP-binding protein [Eubacterium sp.]|jgi:ABC-type sugar transport system, ATPase component|nr:sugar ABC transporter ATP-binding protein [Eubacterium sp.]
MGGDLKQNEIVLEVKGINKSFPGVQALKDINVVFRRGEVHVLIGENGAGKSTLMKILDGIYKADEGEIYLKGEKVEIANPKMAVSKGIAMIHQELSSVMDMTIAENIFLGKEEKKGILIDSGKMKKLTTEYLTEVGMGAIPPATKMKNLSTSQRQMVEIAKALSYNADIIIMDEPTSSITEAEVENLFGIIRKLKSEGKCIVYISHKMDELFEIGDVITVFRDGLHVGDYPVSEVDEPKLIKLMVDRDLSEIYPERKNKASEVALKVENLNQEGVFTNVSFEIRKGEIVGFAGLIGAGRTEVMNAIFGVTHLTSGSIYINDKKIPKQSPKIMKNAGMGYVTEDRKGSGLVLGMDVGDNIILASLDRLSDKAGFINRKKAREESVQYKDALSIKTPSLSQKAGNLSGGNQQKIVLAKWLMESPDIIVFDEPTRGIDVGAKSEIYKLIAQLAEQGKAIIFISSELPEILGMCDRVLVMSEGKISGELPGEEATQEKILALAAAEID